MYLYTYIILVNEKLKKYKSQPNKIFAMDDLILVN